MKLKVIQTFRDKATGELILAGSFFETDDEKRSDDLIKRNLAETEKPKKVTKKKSGD